MLMKNEQASALDIAREKVLEKYALMLQRLARGFIVRRRLLFMRKVLQGLHDAIAKRSDTLLAKWFAQVRGRAWQEREGGRNGPVCSRTEYALWGGLATAEELVRHE